MSVIFLFPKYFLIINYISIVLQYQELKEWGNYLIEASHKTVTKNVSRLFKVIVLFK